MVYLFVILFFSSQIFAQNQLDELIKKIDGLTDTIRIDRLTEFCWKNRSKIPTLALKSGQEAFKIAQNISDFKRQAEALNKIGVVYRNLNNYDKAFEVYNKALRISEKIGDSIQTAFSLNNIGGIYRLQGNYNEALTYILPALGIFERHKYLDGISFCAINIGLIYRRQNLTEKALEYLTKTLEIREKTKDYSGKALAINLIAEVYFEIGRTEEAFKYYLVVEKEYEKLDDQKGLAAAWIGLAQVYLRKNELKNSLDYALKANTLSKKISYFEGVVYSYNRLAKIYNLLGQNKKALASLKEAYKISSVSSEIQIKLETYKAYSELYQQLGDFKSALQFSKRYHSMRDSIVTHESVSLISQMEKDFRKERDEKIKSLSAEKELSEKVRNFVIMLFILCLLLALLIYNRYRVSIKYGQKLSELNAMKDKLFSIIAHDLKNPLHSMFGLTDHLITDYKSIDDDMKINFLSKIDSSGKQILKLLENLLVWSRSQSGSADFSPSYQSLKKLVDEAIAVLEEIAAKKQITISNNIKPEVSVFCDSEMMKTVIRNLVSNAIKFTNTEGYVSVFVEELGKTLKITVKDNGVGMSEEKVKSLFKIDKVSSTYGTQREIGTGLGLILCKDFVEIHKGKIEVESELGVGTKFSIILKK